MRTTRRAKWFSNANETRGETKAAPHKKHLANPPFSHAPFLYSLVFLSFYRTLTAAAQAQAGNQRTCIPFHSHLPFVTSMQINVTLRIRNVAQSKKQLQPGLPAHTTYAEFT